MQETWTRNPDIDSPKSCLLYDPLN